jgi:WD40 repeat protein
MPYFFNASNAFLSFVGGQDGVVRMWDPRTADCVMDQELHTTSSGKGAVNCLSANPAQNLVASAGADGSVQLLDVRSGFQVMHALNTHKDFVYSLHTIGDLVFSGDGVRFSIRFCTF